MKHKAYYKQVRGMIRRYPSYAAALAELRSRKSDGSAARSPGRVSRPTEWQALTQLPDPVAQAEFDAVQRAIDTTRRMTTGAARLDVIRVKYWSGNRDRDLFAAAAAIHYSHNQTWRFHTDFEQLVARYYYGGEQ